MRRFGIMLAVAFVLAGCGPRPPQTLQQRYRLPQSARNVTVLAEGKHYDREYYWVEFDLTLERRNHHYLLFVNFPEVFDLREIDEAAGPDDEE